MTSRTLCSALAGALLGAAALLTPWPADAATIVVPARDRWAQEASASVARGPIIALATPIEVELLELTNRDRASNGLQPLEFDPSMLELARARAAAQSAERPLSHVDGDGRPAIQALLDRSGLDYLLAGENLARVTGSDSSILPRVQQALMTSPTHRQNILEPTFNRLAVGSIVDRDGRVTLAEVFRTAP